MVILADLRLKNAWKSQAKVPVTPTGGWGGRAMSPANPSLGVGREPDLHPVVAAVLAGLGGERGRREAVEEFLHLVAGLARLADLGLLLARVVHEAEDAQL